MALNNVLTEDLNSLLASEIEWSNFKDKRILVTGATGLVGSMVVRSLIYANEKLNLGLKVIGLIRNQAKADKIYEGCMGKDALSFCLDDLSGDEPISLEGKVDYIVHAAAVTTSKIMVSDPVGTIDVALKGTKNILNLAVEKETKGVVYISSMEIYGQSADPEDTKENDLGYVDLAAVRSCYPEGKRMCECMCTACAAQHGIRISSARLAQTFGAGILPTENRVFAQFARSAMQGKDIVLHTKGQSEGNYCYTRDCITGLLTILLKGTNAEAYNVSNPRTHTTIAEMANLVAEKIADGKIKVVFDIPKDNSFGYAADTRMILNSDKLQELGWKPEVGLEEAYRRMIMDMSDFYKNSLEK